MSAKSLYMSARAHPVYERVPSVPIVENVRWVTEACYVSRWVIRPLPLCLPTVCPPILSVVLVPQPIKSIRPIKRAATATCETIALQKVRLSLHVHVRECNLLRMSDIFSLMLTDTHCLLFSIIPTSHSHLEAPWFSHRFLHALLRFIF